MTDDHDPLFNLAHPFITAFKIFVFIFGLLLIIYNIAFQYYPVITLGTFLTYAILHHFHVPAAPDVFLEQVFGQDVNSLISEYREKKGSVVEDLPFVPSVSRLKSASGVKSLSQIVPTAKNSYAMWVVGHRGAGLDAPENSLSAIQLCRSRGCMAVEFDVSITLDNVPVVFHDDDLLRVCGVNKKIHELTYEQLSEYDISSRHPLGNKFPDEKIPTLDEVIEMCLDLDLRFFIDLKETGSKMVDIIMKAYGKFGERMYCRAIVSSFHPSVIYRIRSRDPRIVGCMAWRPSYYRYEIWSGTWLNIKPRHKIFIMDYYAKFLDALMAWALPNFLWWFIGLSAILLNKDAITKESTTRWMKKGVRVFAWTVNDPVEKLHLTQNWNLGFLTDTLDGGEAGRKIMTRKDSSDSSSSDVLNENGIHNSLDDPESANFATPIQSSLLK